MAKLWNEFKEFAIKGNVVDMAVGVVIGSAFGKIVTSLVSDVIMPLVGALTGGVNFTDWKWTISKGIEEQVDAAGAVIQAAKPAVTVNYGNLLQVIFDFVIIALCIFIVIKGINKLKDLKKKEETAAPETAPAPKTEDVVLLEEIRDLLKNQK